MAASSFGKPRTLGVDAERLSDAECFLRRRCESMAAVVMGIMLGGSSGACPPFSCEVDKESNGCCSSGCCTTASRPDAMAKCFIIRPPGVAKSEMGR